MENRDAKRREAGPAQYKILEPLFPAIPGRDFPRMERVLKNAVTVFDPAQ